MCLQKSVSKSERMEKESQTPKKVGKNLGKNSRKIMDEDKVKHGTIATKTNVEA